MIEIITDKNISLDLAPDAEFAIEYEQPLLSDKRVQTPFSTKIGFLPTDKNNKAFNYLPVNYLGVPEREISATLFLNGIPLFQGSLHFDSIENKRINYSFSCNTIRSFGKKKIWEEAICAIHTEEYYFQYDLNNMLERDNVIGAPLLVNRPAIAKQTAAPLNKETAQNDVSKRQDIKYHNLLLDCWENFTPAIRIKSILKSEQSHFIFEELIDNYLEHIAVIGLNRPDIVSTKLPVMAEIASYLPDISFSDFIENILKIFCAGLFYEPQGYKIISAASVLQSDDVWNIDELISDEYSLSLEAAKSYSFSYANSGEIGKNLDLEKEQVSAEIQTAQSYKEVINKFGESYTAVRHEPSGDIYSGKRIKKKPPVMGKRAEAYFSSGPGDILCDIIRHDVGKKSLESNIPETDEEDNSVDFELIASVPIDMEVGIGNGARRIIKQLAGIVAGIKREKERSSKVIIGLLCTPLQISDKGFYIAGPEEFRLIEKGHELSLAPKDLWNPFHSLYASWLAKKKITVSCELSLSPMDVYNFRIWRPVYFRGRKYIVKKMSMTLKASSNVINCKGEFITI